MEENKNLSENSNKQKYIRCAMSWSDPFVHPNQTGELLTVLKFQGLCFLF